MDIIKETHDFNLSKNTNFAEIQTNILPFSEKNINSTTTKVKINYKDTDNNLVKRDIVVNTQFIHAYGNFLSDWDEFIDHNNNLYWFNRNLNKSTWEHPLIILISLISNKIDFSYKVLYWLDLGNNIIKIVLK